MTVRSATLRRQALSLLNGISMGFRSGEYGQIAECAAARFDRLAYARNFARRKLVGDDVVVALEPWRETGRRFRYAQPGAVRTCFRAIAWRVSSVIMRMDSLYDSQTRKGASR